MDHNKAIHEAWIKVTRSDSPLSKIKLTSFLDVVTEIEHILKSKIVSSSDIESGGLIISQFPDAEILESDFKKFFSKIFGVEFENVASYSNSDNNILEPKSYRESYSSKLKRRNKLIDKPLFTSTPKLRSNDMVSPPSSPIPKDPNMSYKRQYLKMKSNSINDEKEIEYRDTIINNLESENNYLKRESSQLRLELNNKKKEIESLNYQLANINKYTTPEPTSHFGGNANQRNMGAEILSRKLEKSIDENKENKQLIENFEKLLKNYKEEISILKSENERLKSQPDLKKSLSIEKYKKLSNIIKIQELYIRKLKSTSPSILSTIRNIPKAYLQRLKFYNNMKLSSTSKNLLILLTGFIIFLGLMWILAFLSILKNSLFDKGSFIIDDYRDYKMVEKINYMFED